MQHAAARAGSAPWQHSRIGRLVLREVAVPSAFVAAILLSSYAMAGLPNVKLFDLLVFVAGYALGFRRGATVAVGAWLVYGQVNPFGAAHVQLLLVLMGSETVYAAAGALARRWMPQSAVRLLPSAGTLVLVASALATTLLYDAVTNVYTGYYWALIAGAGEYARWIGTALFNPGALFFSAVHVSSNVMLFAVFGPLLIVGAHRAKQRLGWA